MPRVTALYAGLMIVLFLGLTLRVFAARFRSGVTLGTGEDRRLLRAVRVHANFAENVPLFLAALLAAELAGAPGPALHATGGLMLLARLLHAAGMSREPDIRPLRAAGALGTVVALGVAAALAIGAGLRLW